MGGSVGREVAAFTSTIVLRTSQPHKKGARGISSRTGPGVITPAESGRDKVFYGLVEEVVMKEYKVYENEQGDIVVVKQGWSWPAFFFPGLWALGARLWVVAAMAFGALLAIDILLGSTRIFLTSWFFAPTSFLVSNTWLGGAGMLVSLVMAGMGNAWKEAKLMRLGYVFRSAVGSSSDIDAQIDHLSERRKLQREERGQV